MKPEINVIDEDSLLEGADDLFDNILNLKDGYNKDGSP